MAELLAIGVTDEPAPTGPSPDLSVPETSAPGLASRLIEEGVASEAVVLSTDRMTELYLVADDGLTAEAAALTELASCCGVCTSLLAGSAYALEEEYVASHLFRIAAGVGGPPPYDVPMKGRVERAHRVARDAGSAGPLLDRLFSDATQVAADAPSGASACGSPTAVDELEVRRWERRVADEVERFSSWRVETLDGELATGSGEAGASVLRFPHPGDAA